MTNYNLLQTFCLSSNWFRNYYPQFSRSRDAEDEYFDEEDDQSDLEEVEEREFCPPPIKHRDPEG